MSDKRCTLKNNSDHDDAKVILIKSNHTYNDLLKIASEKFGFKVKKLFLENGGAIDDIGLIRDNDVVYVSAGEPFSDRTAKDRCPLYSIAVMGPGSVGKSAMTMQYVQGVFIRDYDPTIEDAYRKNTTVDERPCMLDILDTAGQEDYTALRSTWMRERDAFMLVFSICDITTFKGLDAFYDQLSVMHEENMPPLLLVGNKCDLESKRQISSAEGEGLAGKYACHYIETSAKTGKNIDEAFITIIRQLRDCAPEKEKKQKEKKGIKFCAVL